MVANLGDVSDPYSVTLSGGLPAGSYSEDAHFTIPSDCFDFTVQPASIPEYPLGLAVLAILMVIAYGVIR